MNAGSAEGGEKKGELMRKGRQGQEEGNVKGMSV